MRNRGARDVREVEVDERTAQATLDPFPGDAVQLVRVDDGVHDEDRQHVERDEGPHGESLALRRPLQRWSAARSASAT